jgi:hypothetical protein
MNFGTHHPAPGKAAVASRLTGPNGEARRKPSCDVGGTVNSGESVSAPRSIIWKLTGVTPGEPFATSKVVTRLVVCASAPPRRVVHRWCADARVLAASGSAAMLLWQQPSGEPILSRHLPLTGSRQGGPGDRTTRKPMLFALKSG